MFAFLWRFILLQKNNALQKGGHRFLFKVERQLQATFTATAYKCGELTCFCAKRHICAPKAYKLFINCKLNGLALAGLELNFLIALEFHNRTHNAAKMVLNIKLNNLICRTLPKYMSFLS